MTDAEIDEKNRADFIRRIFAVTVSVGFASQLISMEWVKNGGFPNNEEFTHCIFLLVGLLLVIHSWEYYFFSLEKRPLKTRRRFYTDVVIVFTYLILLVSSKQIPTFLFFTAVIFALYVIWDFLRFSEDFAGYNRATGGIASYISGLGDALFGRNKEMRPKISSILFFIWFCLLFIVNYQTNFHNSYTYAAIVALSLFLYRNDQKNPICIMLLLLPLAGVIVYLLWNILS